jgi:hypothetical protein
MVVRFAPYRGFKKSASGNSQLISAGATQGTSPKIIRGWATNAMGKVVVNKFGTQPYREPIVFQNYDMPNKLAPVVTQREDGKLPQKPKAPIISKFRAKSR